MKRATVERVYRVREGNWYVLIWINGWFDHGRTFPTHAAALAHALTEVGLAPDLDPSRCPMRATDPIATRNPRDDGWRCGYEVGHSGGHYLFTSDGEDVLYAGRWVHPAEVGLTENTEKEKNR